MAQKDLTLTDLNRIRTIQGSLAIEGNTLSEEQITAILEGKRVIAPPRRFKKLAMPLKPMSNLKTGNQPMKNILLIAHQVLMTSLIDNAGHYRSGNVGVMNGDVVEHMAPPANRVKKLMGDLFNWLATTDQHPLITSSIFHYELEFIHPFTDAMAAWDDYGKP